MKNAMGFSAMTRKHYVIRQTDGAHVKYLKSYTTKTNVFVFDIHKAMTFESYGHALKVRAVRISGIYGTDIMEVGA